ncbi:MAG: ComF family protein, partial [Pseudomonadota bacterium]
LDLVPTFTTWLQRAATTLPGRPDLVVPVPLHMRRLWGRGFNQAAELARGYARAEGLAHLPGLLRRTRATGSMRGLSRVERKAAVDGAFALGPQAPRAQLSGARVLLVDDVMTTGATLGACAEVLLDAGARDIFTLVLARVEGARWREPQDDETGA